MLQMLAEARRTRRTVRLHIHARLDNEKQGLGGVIVGTAWPALETSHIEEEIASIERIGQRYEGRNTGMPQDSFERVTVKFTAAPDQSLVGDLELESIQLVALICAIEREFDLIIENEDFRWVRTVDNLIQAIEMTLE